MLYINHHLFGCFNLSLNCIPQAHLLSSCFLAGSPGEESDGVWLAERSLGVVPESLKCIPLHSRPVNQDMNNNCLTLVQLQVELLAHSACPAVKGCNLSKTVIPNKPSHPYGFLVRHVAAASQKSTIVHMQRQ